MTGHDKDYRVNSVQKRSGRRKHRSWGVPPFTWSVIVVDSTVVLYYYHLMGFLSQALIHVLFGPLSCLGMRGRLTQASILLGPVSEEPALPGAARVAIVLKDGPCAPCCRILTFQGPVTGMESGQISEQRYY